MPRATEIGVALIGASGRVGRQVLALIAAHGAVSRLRLVAVANSRTHLLVPAGLDPNGAVERLQTAPPADADLLTTALAALPRPVVIVDCTASAQVAAQYPRWLGAGIDIVTPNKFGPSAERPLRDAIAAAQTAGGTLLRDSGTVGAHLPLLGTLRELRQAGDQVESFEAVLSGTLSFVLGSVQQGQALSAAVHGAIALGFAEPNPARDLSGEDAARKLVIMLRALGHDVAYVDIERVALVEPGLVDGVEAARFPAVLREVDETWRARTAIADARHERWVYRATYAHGRARVAPERIALEHPFARLASCENALILRSKYYAAAPLTIAGPGAGIDLTATAVFADLLDAARRHAAAPVAELAAAAA
ncbi:MAG TPA: homoserine dehydrogenase [Rudaea sp.]|nr:homoserine dehydrogenase [Rudaea sp.]